MKERPILFNADMVRAVLDGRKMQTRRVMKVQPHAGVRNSPFVKSGIEDGHGKELVCPFGEVGDRLWVRETFRVHSRATDVATLVYKASEQQSWTQQTHRVPIEKCNKPAVVDKWTPSIHMPRWASRITLEITGVRVERLNSISEADAKAEGLAEITKDGSLFKFGIPDRDGYPGTDDKGWPWTEWERNPVDAYCKLWQSLYGEESWQANPWVWVVEFKRVEGE
ncbi:hypothetical protein [Pantoea agglomerans]|uniref:hypothetical protein n=1 Tax=Enterobacter agglomerans TaxID=549 RepID=UPI000DFA52C2|nr:hypothetical protein [Pantoea agglomerans]SUB07778.1 Uncharacterised protein [Pantoea agglomerans]